MFWRRKCARSVIFRNVEEGVPFLNPYFVCDMATGSLCDLLGQCTKWSLSLGETPVLTNSRHWKCKHCTFKWENGDFQKRVIN